ncbi:MAG: GNAT family N-acetyltransferase [Bacteroidetes bacterium]|nr:GNAT family N-acetyltransferase [Bacteroidota bacterium]
MIELKSISHSDISPREVEEIIKIKSLSWKYSFNEHEKWIKKNLKNADIHLMLFDGKNFIAYMNLISIQLSTNNVFTGAFGVGNVCTKRRGRGYGSQLMEASNKFLVAIDMLGLLFCRPSLVHFYLEHGWELLDKEILKLDFENSNIDTMIYNCEKKVTQLEYEGDKF